MSRNVIETLMGAVVLAIAAVFLLFAYRSADLGPVRGYELMARFDRIDGLPVGSDVRISGVRVGSVTAQSLDPETFLAVVHMAIDPGIRLPTDTVALIASESLLGGRFLSLDPGGEEEIIPPGGTIQFTQSTPGIEQLLGQVIFNLQSIGSNAGAAAPGGDAVPPAGGAGAGGAVGTVPGQ